MDPSSIPLNSPNISIVSSLPPPPPPPPPPTSAAKTTRLHPPVRPPSPSDPATIPLPASTGPSRPPTEVLSGLALPSSTPFAAEGRPAHPTSDSPRHQPEQIKVILGHSGRKLITDKPRPPKPAPLPIVSRVRILSNGDRVSLIPERTIRQDQMQRSQNRSQLMINQPIPLNMINFPNGPPPSTSAALFSDSPYAHVPNIFLPPGVSRPANSSSGPSSSSAPNRSYLHPSSDPA